MGGILMSGEFIIIDWRSQAAGAGKDFLRMPDYRAYNY